jgi:hypothetical protein
MNLGFGIANIIGPRAFLNFIIGRYHTPVEENRFVLFVDIAGSTGLAERLGGVGIHRFLDRTFRLLTLAVVDYRGEVLDYVGDEAIVTWREASGAVDCRPLQCFVAMRDELARASGPACLFAAAPMGSTWSESARLDPLHPTGLSVTRNPSFGFGIGHICQAGVYPGSSETERFCRKCRAKHFACM